MSQDTVAFDLARHGAVFAWIQQGEWHRGNFTAVIKGTPYRLTIRFVRESATMSDLHNLESCYMVTLHDANGECGPALEMWCGAGESRDAFLYRVMNATNDRVKK